jgi:diguanylate cyclase (GGDEF)-like protein
MLALVSLIALIIYLRHHYQHLVHSRFRASQTEFLALHDTLTALPNRLLFDDRLNSLLSNWRRRYESFGLVFIDLDHFKEINDQFGHKTGDLVLIEIAQRIRACVRETDTVARLGGDEFVVLLGQVNSREHLLSMARQMLTKINGPMVVGEETIQISASIGISLCPEDGIDASALLHRADSSMYLVKKNGRNGVMGHENLLFSVEKGLHEQRLHRVK